MRVKRVGSRSRDDLLEIVEINAYKMEVNIVTVRETMGGNCIIGGFPLRRARRLAKGTMYPTAAKRAIVINRFTYQGCENVTFMVAAF